MTIQERIAKFNEAFPVGTPVRYWPGGREGEGHSGQIRSEAWEVCGQVVAKVTGYAGGISVTHIERDRPSVEQILHDLIVSEMGPLLESLRKLKDLGEPKGKLEAFINENAAGADTVRYALLWELDRMFGAEAAA